MSDIVVLDTETSGVSEKGRVLELAFIVHDKRKGYIPFHTLAKVASISPMAMATHHITPDMIADKDLLVETLPYQFLNEELNKNQNIIVGHNIKFDIDMLAKDGFQNKMKVIDTLKCSRTLAPGLSSYSLQFLRYFLEIYKQEQEWMDRLNLDSILAHSALGDALVTLILFERLKAKFGIDKLIEATEFIPTDMELTFGKYKGTMLKELVKTDRSYVNWLAENARDEEVMRIAKGCLE